MEDGKKQQASNLNDWLKKLGNRERKAVKTMKEKVKDSEENEDPLKVSGIVKVFTVVKKM